MNRVLHFELLAHSAQWALTYNMFAGQLVVHNKCIEHIDDHFIVCAASEHVHVRRTNGKLKNRKAFTDQQFSSIFTNFVKCSVSRLPSYVCCTLYTSSRMDDTMCADVVGPCTGENDYIRFVWMKLRKSANGKHVERMKCCRVVIAVTYVNRSRLSHRTCNNRRHTGIDAHKMFMRKSATPIILFLVCSDRQRTSVLYDVRKRRIFIRSTCVNQKNSPENSSTNCPFNLIASIIHCCDLPYNCSEWLTFALQIMIDFDKRIQNYHCTRCFASLVYDIYIIPSLQMPLE